MAIPNEIETVDRRVKANTKPFGFVGGRDKSLSESLKRLSLRKKKQEPSSPSHRQQEEVVTSEEEEILDWKGIEEVNYI